MYSERLQAGRRSKSAMISLPQMIKEELTVPRPMDGIFDPLDRVK
jgi:hypothetical protein